MGLESGAVATLLVDSAPTSEQRPADAPTGAAGQLPPDTPSTSAASAAGVQSCTQCKAPLAAGQDWCLQCGASAPGSIGSPGWRSTVTILAATALLALGAAAAGYAALSKKPRKGPVVTRTVAQAPPPATATPTTPITPGTPTTITPSVPTTAVKPPKIPLTTPAETPALPVPTGSTPQPTTPTSTTPTTPTGGAAAEPTPLLLDTNAASTYNPYNYPATDFGDPSLTIDGDTATGWTALLEPATAPKMAEGVLIDLKAHKKLTAVKLTTTSPGMTVQLYGANGAKPPASITDPAWTALSHSQVVSKKHVRINLKHKKKAFTFLVLWISQAPASAVGTATAPGHVSVNELELFPAS